MPVLGSPDEFDPALARFPTQEEKEREMRLFFILRKDALPSPADLARLAGLATWRVLERAMAEAPDRFKDYWEADAQPKIALKVKNASQLKKTLDALGSIPHVTIDGADGTPIITAVGPACRAELGHSLRKLQVLDAETPAVPAKAADAPGIEAGSPGLLIVVRKDAEMPYGKLCAQSGHAVMGALRRLPGALSEGPAFGTQGDLKAWNDAGARIGAMSVPDIEAMTALSADASQRMNTAFIVDLGRTVFKQPTATVLGLGPTDGGNLLGLMSGLGRID